MAEFRIFLVDFRTSLPDYWRILEQAYQIFGGLLKQIEKKSP